MSAGELMLTTTRRIGTRVMTGQSWDNFVPGRGIMLWNNPHFLFFYLLYLFLVMWSSCDHIVTHCSCDVYCSVTSIVLWPIVQGDSIVPVTLIIPVTLLFSFTISTSSLWPYSLRLDFCILWWYTPGFPGLYKHDFRCFHNLLWLHAVALRCPSAWNLQGDQPKSWNGPETDRNGPECADRLVTEQRSVARLDLTWLGIKF